MQFADAADNTKRTYQRKDVTIKGTHFAEKKEDLNPFKLMLKKVDVLLLV